MLRVKYEEFIEMLSKDKSANTISSYRSDLEQFILFVSDKELSKQLVIDYKKQLEEQFKPATINRKLVVINKFITFLGLEGNKVKVNTVQKKQYIEDVFTIEEVETLISSAKEYKDYRAAAIFTTLAHTGLRVSEMLSITMDDADQEAVTIKGKGDKYRDLLFSDKVRDSLSLYIQYERSKHYDTKEKALFVGQRGSITRTRVDAIIKDYCKTCDIDAKKAHAHAFRHYTALRLVDNGLDIGSIADVLGHSQITTTAIYTKRSKEQIRGFMNRI